LLNVREKSPAQKDRRRKNNLGWSPGRGAELRKRQRGAPANRRKQLVRAYGDGADNCQRKYSHVYPLMVVCLGEMDRLGQAARALLTGGGGSSGSCCVCPSGLPPVAAMVHALPPTSGKTWRDTFRLASGEQKADWAEQRSHWAESRCPISRHAGALRVCDLEAALAAQG
jgi:hypothetical protein